MTKLERLKIENKRLKLKIVSLKQSVKVKAEKIAKIEIEKLSYDLQCAKQCASGHLEQVTSLVRERKEFKAKLYLKDLEMEALRNRLNYALTGSSK